MQVEPKKILVIQTAFLGDVVLTTPLLSAIKDGFPKASLSVLVVPRTKEILSGHPAVDEVLVYDKKGDLRGLRGLIRTARLLKSRGFDLCLLPHRSFRSAILAYLARIPRRIGFKKSAGSLFYTDRVFRDPTRHEVDRNLSLLAALEIEPASAVRHLKVASDPVAREAVDRILKTEGVKPGDCLIGMAPGSVWATKRWLPEGFAAVADTLIVQYQASILLLGSREDETTTLEIIARCRQRPVNLAGQPISELVATLARCRLLITNDNGAMHIGTALSVPVVAVFGSTSSSGGYGPYTKRAEIVEHTLPCRPCGLHGYRRCPLGHFKCMKDIGPEEVMAAVRRQIVGAGPCACPGRPEGAAPAKP